MGMGKSKGEGENVCSVKGIDFGKYGLVKDFSRAGSCWRLGIQSKGNGRDRKYEKPGERGLRKGDHT